MRRTCRVTIIRRSIRIYQIELNRTFARYGPMFHSTGNKEHFARADGDYAVAEASGAVDEGGFGAVAHGCSSVFPASLRSKSLVGQRQNRHFVREYRPET
jgi:hypothetical protein